MAGCQSCDVLWQGPDNCWICGQPATPYDFRTFQPTRPQYLWRWGVYLNEVPEIESIWDEVPYWPERRTW